VTRDITVPVVTSAAEVGAQETEKVAAKEAEEKAATTKAGQDALKAARIEGRSSRQGSKRSQGTGRSGQVPGLHRQGQQEHEQGTARLSVLIPSPGSLVVTARGSRRCRGIHGTGQVEVLIAAKGKALKTLDAKAR